MDNRPNYFPGNQSNWHQNPTSNQNPYLRSAYDILGQQQSQQVAPPSGYPQEETQPQVTVIRGRIVSSVDDIVPGETPMDGLPSVFPTKDLSRVYIRYWNRQGELKTQSYIMEQPPVQQQMQFGPWEDIQMRLANIETALSSMLTKPKKASKAGSAANEEGNAE